MTDRVPGAASVNVLALVGVGGRDETAAQAGVSHFLEHLLCKGSTTRASDVVAEDVDARGGDLDAFTDRERTAVQLRVPAHDLGFAVDLVGDLVLRPAMRPDEIEVERRVILEELAQALDDPEDRAHTLTNAALYGDHPLAREIIGDRRTLHALGVDAIGAFHRAEYHPRAMVVAAAGAVVHDEVVEMVARWDDGAAPHPPSALAPRGVPGLQPRTTEVVRQGGEQVTLVLSWPLGPVDQPTRLPLAVLAHILGGGPASRLFRTVRDERGLAYAVDASLALYSDVGHLAAFAACSPEAVAPVRATIAAEVERLASEGPTPREVEVAVGYVAGSSTLALEDTGTRSWWAAIGELERGGARPATEWIDAYRRVTVDQVRQVARRLAGDPTVVAVGPVPRRTRL
ncbi:insulinase family protein [Iamia sp. SCSIO 61187]|uniref:M16 family metallopeptidase n=1 Tax=Iamia sp. SCSIO 61187 TaxID=2722752 RepID=UPI001C6263B8|nr:pitrilysin family protein [Iamia sp. SCSIO 61187]QYG93294.1 insulinase family protein [Iamia sp. SCSIO 61187]